MDKYFPLIFAAIFVLVVGNMLYGRLKFGSWTGALLKGSIEKTHGEVAIHGSRGGSQVMKVLTLREDDGDRVIGLVITAKSGMSVNMTPFRLSKEQSRQLADLLALAAK